MPTFDKYYQILTMKLKLSALITLILCILFADKINAQSAISLSTGISLDLNNSNKTFYHIPVSLQWAPFSDPKNPLLFEFDYAAPLVNKKNANAYTLNPYLPEEVTLQQNTHAVLYTASVGVKVYLFSIQQKSSFYLNLMAGFCHQNLKVIYKNYDNADYEVLNPDVNLKKGGIVLSMAVSYYFNKSKDAFVMLHMQSPLARKRPDYTLSHKYMAPMQLTFGYNFFYNKKK